ncbi:MAG: TetR family transcriptional regulator [Actinomycetota bacterium]
MSEVTPLKSVRSDDLDDAPLDPEAPRAADGRVPGRRGRATRQRLLECTAEMLTTTSYRDVKVIDIAREAGTSPATFYQYFADVEAAILVLAEQMAQQGEHLTEIIASGAWDGEAASDTALELVDAFLRFWDEHRAVLRVVDLATDEGDGRFQKMRVGLLNGITRALAEVTRASQVAGRLPKGIDPMATAGILVSMLAHVAAHQYGFEFWGIRTAHLRASMARQISWGVTGVLPRD